MKPTKTHGLFDNLRYVLKRCVRHSVMVLLLQLLIAVMDVLKPFLTAYLPKVALQLLEAGADIMHAVLMLAGFTLILCIAYAVHGRAAANYWNLINVRIEWMQEAFLQSLACPYRKVESPEGQLLYQETSTDLSNGDGSSIMQFISAVTALTGSLLGFGLYTGMLSQLSPLVIALLVATSFITVICPWLYARYVDKNIAKWTLLGKKLYYIQTSSYEPTLGKDVRLYGMQKWLCDVRDEYLKKRAEWDKKLQNRTFVSQMVNLLVLLLRDGLAYGYLILQALRGEIALPDVALYIGLISGFSQWVTGIVTKLADTFQYSRRLSGVRSFEDYLPDDAPRGTEDVPDGPICIEFDDVTFAYPEANRPTLEHLSFKIEAGEKIALVGVNGAGKTTLVKLLCGFYAPTAGCIRINGRDMSTISPEKMMEACSAVFQDVLILPFTVAENIAMKSLDQIDRERVAECLQRAGLYERIAEEKKGINTNITRVVSEDGLLLSGGESQKLILARALYKDGRLLLLDEPTAALDPIAESAQYQQYLALGKDKTSIFISHRLASTRFCDRILFLSGGRITESGSHEELMALGGAYAEMYELQSRYYREGGDAV